MEKIKRLLASFLVVLMVLPSVPLQGLVGVEWLTLFDGINVEAEAASTEHSKISAPIFPLDTYQINYNNYPNYNSGGYHGGIDIAAKTGTPIRSTYSGKIVIKKSLTYSYGKHIIIESSIQGKKYKIYYAHMSSMESNIDVGTEIKAGQIIGYVGSTGNSSGPHLHYEVREWNASSNSWKRVDPRDFLPGYNNTKYIYDYVGDSSNKSTALLTGTNIVYPKTVRKGVTFPFSGTISSTTKFPIKAVTVFITKKDPSAYSDKESFTACKLIKKYEQNLLDMLKNKVYTVDLSTVCKDLDTSVLEPGNYKIYIGASSGLSLFQKFSFTGNTVEDIKSSFVMFYEGEFSVTSAAKTRAASSGSGYTYGTIKKLVLTEGASSSNSGSSGGSFSSGNSYYNSNSSYPVGNYKVTAKSGLNTRKSPSATSTKLGGLSYGKVVEVTSTNGNWGYTAYGWICLDYTSYQSAISTPVYNDVNYGTGNYVVTTPAGLNVRSGPGTNYGVLKTVKHSTEFAVTDVDGSWGYCADLNGWLCLNYAQWMSDLVPELPTPATPVLTTDTSSEIGVGDIITVKWNAVDFTDSYTLSLIDKSTGNVVETKSDVTGTEASFVVPHAGTFDVSIVAVNSQHTSKMSKVQGITAKAPSTVTFKDWDGRVISTQKVAYGKDATLPANPTRTGYTFTKWSGRYQTIREDSVVTAEYERNTYKVTFYDYDGTKVIDTQKVLYQDSAVAPSYTAPTGYSFVKWDKDFSSITADTSVKAVIHWTSAYPLEVSTSSTIYRNNTAYITTAIVNNSPKAVTNAKVIVALKTAEGKQLAEAKSANLSLAAGEVKTISLTATYDGAATVGNIFVVKADDENIPLSKHLTVKVDQGTAWSTWSTAAPPANALKVESRTEYRYRTKAYTTSSNSSLSGWTKYNTTSAYSDWSGWSAWQDSAVSANDLREVKTQQVTDYNNFTAWSGWSAWQDAAVNATALCNVETQQVVASENYGYKYYYYRYASSDGSVGSDKKFGKYQNYEEIVVDSPLTTLGSMGNYGQGYYYKVNGKNHSYWPTDYLGVPCQRQYVISYNYKTQYRYQTRNYAQKTQYSYRTRSLNYTYYYYKWNDWSGWSTTAQTANSDKDVQTRTTYRYISNDPKNIEDTAGQSRTIKGVVDKQYAGKQALLHIYTSNGATQFLGQTTVDSTGAYSYTFKLKSEPTVSSGDYFVAMSIEGTTSAFMLDPILAPVPEYTVIFKNYDGSIIQTQKVKKGGNATLPTSPTRTGYDFIGWSDTGANIQKDTTITANFKIKTFDVIFVDNLMNTRTTESFNYGDTLVAPELKDTDAYQVLGWDAVLNGIKTVTENMVVTAQYKIKMFTVTFYDFEGNVLKSDKVPYGDGVETPTLENKSPYVFVSWNTNEDLGYITKDIDVYPTFEYEKTVETPTASVETGSYNSTQTVTLSCETEGAKIYYTTDGGDPLEEVVTKARSTQIKGTEYNGPFTLDSSANLVFVAVKDNMNSSWYNDATYSINTDSTTQKQHLVTLHDDLYYNGTSYLVDDGSTAIVNEDMLNQVGYTLVDVYTNEDMTDEWNINTDKVTDSVDLWLKWEKNTYTVEFLDKDGNIIDSQDVGYLDSANPPVAPEIDGFVFSGWDTSYADICEDTTIKATYLKEDSIAKVRLNNEKIKLNMNEQYKLESSVELAGTTVNNHVVWQSSDETVATVDDSGKVTAVAYGNVQIYAISEESGDVATCSVTVGCSHNYTANVFDPTCIDNGFTVYTCDYCSDEYIDDEVSVDNNAHSFNEDGICELCGYNEQIVNCDHLCHKDGFIGFFWKIIRFLWKIFGMNPVCDCGVAHY